MALTNAMLKATLAAPLIAVAFTTSAQYNSQYIEPSTTELSKPLSSRVCVKTTAGQPFLTAFDKLRTIIDARGQIVVATADQAIERPKGGAEYKGILLTTAANGSEGYIIRSDRPRLESKAANEFCLRPIRAVNIYDVFTANSVPPEVNKGEFGRGFTKARDSGFEIMMTGISGPSRIAVSHRKDGFGSISEANLNGNDSGDTSILLGLKYTAEAQQLLRTTLAPATPK